MRAITENLTRYKSGISNSNSSDLPKMGNPANWDYELAQVDENEHIPVISKPFLFESPLTRCVLNDYFNSRLFQQMFLINVCIIYIFY